MVQTKEERREKRKEYDQSPKGKKSRKISSWKIRGLLCDSYEEYEQIYERWFNSKKCEKCDKKYEEDNWKCMDHEHSTGLFRNILCNCCNVNDTLRNTSGYPNIYHNLPSGLWQYKKTFKKKTHSKYFKKKEEAIEYKIKYES